MSIIIIAILPLEKVLYRYNIGIIIIITIIIITSGQSNLEKTTSPPHMDSSVVFAGLRQCAPSSNTCFLGPTRVHVPNDISICSAIFAQLTVEDPNTLQ